MRGSPTARLPPRPLEWIDRRRPIMLRFEGEPLTAFTGDSLASALWGHGHRVLGYSLKLRRPRGLDSGTLLDDEELGLLSAERTLAKDGMKLRRVHGPAGGPAPAWAQHGSKLVTGGLYDSASLEQSTFESSVRGWVGLQRYDARAERTYAKRHETAEVVVVGAGLAGMAAALAAGAEGARVILVEVDAVAGGMALHDSEGRDALVQLRARVDTHPQIELRVSTAAVGVYADRLVALLGPTGLCKVRAGAIVLATGASDVPAVFRNNDLPGVLSASAARRLIDRYRVLPGRTAVVWAASDDGRCVARALREAGARVALVADARAAPSADATSELAMTQYGAVVEEAHAHEDGTLRAVTVRGPDGERTTVECDVLIVSGGSRPDDQLAIHAMPSHRPAFVAVALQVAPRVWAAGRLRGPCDAAAAIAEGALAGRLSCGASTSRGDELLATRETESRGCRAEEDALPIVAHPSGACFVDLDEDVDLDDIATALDEGFDQSALLTAYTKLGRGHGQGRSSHVNAARVLSARTGTGLAAVGRALPRPPLIPVPMGILAGRAFRPRRRTSLHDWHVAHGAELLLADDWERPAFYRTPETRVATVAAEVRAVREGVGLIDVGTLGKIELLGPDAGALLERVYTGLFADMPVGTARYALMCDESGVIIDDGIVARLASDRFYVTTTTSASSSVYREFSRWVMHEGLDVTLVNLTGSFAAFNLAGPRALRLLGGMADDRAAVLGMRYMAALETTLGGTSVRVLRVGFVGEVSYELHLPATAARAAWEWLVEEGRGELRPFGVEAQRLLRLEKAHLILGQDTDGLAIPAEVGLQWAVKGDKPFFVGQRSLLIRSRQPRARTLVGFELAGGEPSGAVRECSLVMDGAAIAGRVTSVGHSATLGKTIGLAFVPPSLSALGSALSIRATRTGRVAARVVATPFYDPTSRRQHEVTA